MPATPTDDRSQPTRYLRLDELPAGAPLALRNAVMRIHIGFNWRFVQATTISILIPTLTVVLVSAINGHSSPWRVVLPVVGVGAFVTVLVTVIGTGFVRRRWRRELRIECDVNALCMQCGYRLEGLPAAPDGCTVCPECGAAWRYDFAARSRP